MAVAKLIARLAPATVADCAKDYKQHQQPEVAADARNLHASGQASAGGNSGWHGRRT